MNSMGEMAVMLGVFAGSLLVGYLLISKVPPLLHTPLMSMTNAISAITILGALILFGTPMKSAEKVIAAVALLMATFNVVGGFAITDRMLGLFRKRRGGK